MKRTPLFLILITFIIIFESPPLTRANTAYNICLRITDAHENIAFPGLNVTVYDLNGTSVTSATSNQTGYVNLNMSTGSYTIVVQSGNRTVGYQEITVNKSETLIIRTWAYNLNVTFLNEDGKPLTNHTIFLYDQMVFQAPKNYTIITDSIGRLISRTETDGNGTVHLFGLWNGTYRIKVVSGEASGDYVLDLQKPTSITLKCIKVDLTLKFISESNAPIRNATICIYNNLGHLFFKNHTNQTGYIEYKNIYVIDGLYAVSARYENRTVGYEMINVTKSEVFTIVCWAYNVTVKCVDQDNKPLPDRIIFLYDQLVFYTPINFTTVTNQTGLLVNWTKTNENGTAYFKDVWNGTYIYAVSARYGNRTVGYEMINVTKSEVFTIVCWAYNLTVKCVDQENKPLPDHIVFLYDQLVFYTPINFTTVTNQTGLLVNWTKTNENGTAYFKDVWNGTYRIKVMAGELIGEEKITLQRSESIILKCNKTSLVLRFVTGSDEPLLNATIYIYGSTGHLIFRDHTDQNGYIRHESIYLDNYTVFAEWMETEVWSGIVNIYQDGELRIRCSVFRLTLRFVDPFGNALPGAKVVVLKRKGMVTTEYLRLEANATGYVSHLLLRGSYEVRVSLGIYSTSMNIDLEEDHKVIATCGVKTTVWILTLTVATPIIGVTALLERKKGKQPLKARKYKRMLAKLDSMYERGLIEYRVYRKLREEYEEVLIKLGREAG